MLQASKSILTKEKVVKFKSALKDRNEKLAIRRGKELGINIKDIKNILANDVVDSFIDSFDEEVIIDSQKEVEKALKIMLKRGLYKIQSVTLSKNEIITDCIPIGVTGIGEYMPVSESAMFITQSLKLNFEGENVVTEKIVETIIEEDSYASPQTNIVLFSCTDESFWNSNIATNKFYGCNLGTEDFFLLVPSKNLYGELCYINTSNGKLMPLEDVADMDKIEFKAVMPNKAQSKLATVYLYNSELLDLDNLVEELSSGASTIALEKGSVKDYERVSGMETPSHNVGVIRKYALLEGVITDRFGNNMLDGWSVLNKNFLAKTLTEASQGLFKFSEDAVKGCSFQCKCSGVDKSNRTAVEADFVKMMLQIAKEQGVNIKLVGCTDFMEVDAIFDTDCLKAPIKEGEPIYLNIASFTKKPSKPSIGLQTLTKFLFSSGKIKNLFKGLNERKINSVKESIEAEFKALRPSDYESLGYALEKLGFNPVEVDNSIKRTRINPVANNLNEEGNKMKYEVDGGNTVAIPCIVNLVAGTEVIGYNEYFWNEFNNKFLKLENIDDKLLILNDRLSKASDLETIDFLAERIESLELQKEVIMIENDINEDNGEYTRDIMIIKNPTQGKREYHLAKCISSSIIQNRLEAIGVSDERISIVINFIESLHVGSSMSTSYKQLQLKLAGYDFDWDKLSIITDNDVLDVAKNGYIETYTHLN